ncbi:hypothetical protein D6779_05785, partial [Candidatus Parcubacteria bacterium]
QISGDRLTIIPHEYPDLDAITAAWFVRMHALEERVRKTHQLWAEYVCRIDQGHTTLNPSQPVTPYSLFMMRMHQLRNERTTSKGMLLAGFEFLEKVLGWMEQGGDPSSPDADALTRLFPAEAKAVVEDLALYNQDLKRAEKLECTLPIKNGSGSRKVPGLWIEKPESAMFKSWARGDRERAGNDHGFVFLGVQVGDQRFILSVDPASDVYLKGLGAALEEAEVVKRKKLGLERVGENRPGYDSPDPWYDGRSPLHNYTIIDSPRCGTVLRAEEVRQLFQHWMAGIKTERPV